MTIILKPFKKLQLPSAPNLKRTREPAHPLRMGDSVSVDMLHNCLTCSRWAQCRDPKKMVNYRCSRYREATIDLLSIEEIFDSEMDIESKKADESIFIPEEIDEDSIAAMIERVMQSNVPVPPDLRIKDEHIPQAKNFLEWATSDKFAGGGMPPFPRQIEIGTKLFAEWCPACSDADWFDEMPVDAPISEIQDRVVFLEDGICPECNRTKPQLVKKGYLLDYMELCAIAGQRSSKTTSVNLWDGYNLHKYLKLPNPASVYGLLSSQILVMTQTALTFAQAVENSWNPFLSQMRNTPWFKNYHSFLDHKGEELGEELFHLGEHSIRYRHRNLFLAPSGPSKRTMRGRTRASASIDEAGWFPLARKGDKKIKELERLDAKGVYDALKNSLFTVKAAYRRRLEEGYRNLPKPMLYMMSSPQSHNDFIMTVHRAAFGSKEIYTFRYPTWEYNPLIKKRDLEENFRSNAVTAERDFACNPPIGEGLFIEDLKVAEKAFSKTEHNALKVITGVGLSKTRQRVTTSEVHFPTEARPRNGTILSIDIGLVANSFAFSIIGLPDGYTPYDEEDYEDDDRMPLTPVKVWGCGEVIPKADARIALGQLYRNCLIPIVEEFNVSYLVSDRWQNAKLMQDLEEQYSVIPQEVRAKWEDFEVTRELIYGGELLMPKLPVPYEGIIQTTLDNYPEVFRNRHMEHLFFQMATVREQTGVTVTKGDGSTDDLFRTIVLGAAMLQDSDVVEELLSFSAIQPAESQPALGMVKKMSGGQGGGSRSGGSGNLMSSSGVAIGVKKSFGSR